jgi:hypothetical protein
VPLALSSLCCAFLPPEPAHGLVSTRSGAPTSGTTVSSPNSITLVRADAALTTAVLNPQIQIVKQTNGTNNDLTPVAGTPDGPIIVVGGPVNWTYAVTALNSTEPIAGVVVTDDNGTPGDSTDDFHPAPVLSGGFNVGDTNHDNLLDPTETWQYSASSTAQLGQYSNVASVTGTGNVSHTPVGPVSNPDHYFGVDAFIQITPQQATNPVNTPHTFTITVTALPGVPDLNSSFVTFSTPTITYPGGAPDLAAPTTATFDHRSGNTAFYTLTINSSVAGAFEVKARDNITFSSPMSPNTAQNPNPLTLTRTTGDGYVVPGTPSPGSDSADAFKSYFSLTIVKTADQDSVPVGGHIGFTVTIGVVGPAGVIANGVQLTDPLPAGNGNDLTWTIDAQSGTTFQIVGTTTPPNQQLTLDPTVQSLAVGSYSVHILSSEVTTADAGGSGTTVSLASNFNGTAIQFGSAAGGSYVWYTSHFAAKGMPTSGSVHFHVTNQDIVFDYKDPVTHLPVHQDLVVPDSDIIYDSAATTIFSGGKWVTTVPLSYTGNVFFSGLAFQVPANGLPGGINPVTWTGTFTVDETFTTAPSLQWQWAAAAYTKFDNTPNNPGFQAADYSNLLVKPVDSNTLSAYHNSDKAGTPEGSIGGTTIKSFVTGGARGGGGSNFTGSNSGTIKVTPSEGGGQLVNSATVSAGDLTVTDDASVNLTLHQLAATASTMLSAGNLLGSVKPGVYLVAVDNLPAGAAEQARIADAIATINAELGSFGVVMEQVSAADATSADVHINFAEAAFGNSLADGTLGVMSGANITLIGGWNYYLGSDRSGIGADQYDFQTLVTHELAHVVGLGEGSDPASVMSLYLAPGQVRRDFSANDLALIAKVNGFVPTSVPAVSPRLGRPDALDFIPMPAGSSLGVALDGDRYADNARAVWVGSTTVALAADTDTALRLWDAAKGQPRERVTNGDLAQHQPLSFLVDRPGDEFVDR